MDAKEILEQCVEPIPWDDEEQEEHFFYLLDNQIEEAWEQIAYYWWADYMAPSEWWIQMAEAATQIGCDRKFEYAIMRMNLVSVGNKAKENPGELEETKEFKIHLFTAEVPPETGMYMVWMENEYKAGWDTRMWIGREYDYGEPVSDQAPSIVFNGTWSTQAYDAPILYWANLPEPPREHQNKSMRLPE